MSRAPTASVGVDVDSLQHYYRIHGLDDRGATNAVWKVGVPRFVELFDALGIPATFYCIAEDLETPAGEANAERLRGLVAAGHEVGNHTWHHRYDLTRLSRLELQAEVGEGRRRLEEAAGAPVVGFRAPGYTTTGRLQAAVAATGHRYDSSAFPCAPYYLAKATVMGLMRLRGRRSRSVLDAPRVLLAPKRPYRAATDDPYSRGAGLPQFPIAVAAGVPLIGTAFTALGAVGSLAALEVGLRTLPHLTLEFHALDLLGLRDDGLDPALAVQPDLRATVARKHRIFRRVLDRLRRHARVVRLDALAAENPYVPS